MAEIRPKLRFYVLRSKDGGTWQVMAHCPPEPAKYIEGFATKADAQAWATGAGGQDWLRAQLAKTKRRTNRNH
jgi:hypothetical protein